MTTRNLVDYLKETSEFSVNTVKLQEPDIEIYDVKNGVFPSHGADAHTLYVIFDKNTTPSGKAPIYAATFQSETCPSLENAVNLFLIKAPSGEDTFHTVFQGFQMLREIEGPLLALYQEMATGQGMQLILDRASAFLGNPLFLLDQTFHLLSQTPHPFALKNRILEEEMSLGHLLPESIRQIRRTKILDKILASRGPYVWQVPQGLTFAACPIRYGHIVLAYMILVKTETPLSSRDLLFLKQFEKLVACEMMKDSTLCLTNGGYRYAEVLDNLVSGRENHQDIPAYLASLGYTLKSETTLLLISPNRGSREDTYAFHQVGNQLERLLGHGMYLIQNHAILYMYDSDQPLSQSRREEISEMLSSSHLACGISSTRTGLFSLPRQKEEAVMALRLGRKLDPGKNLYRYTEYQAFHAVSLARPAISTETLAQGLAAKLINYDKKYHTSLIRTLGTWLMEGGNLHHTASRLYIHENTLRYRLKKIESMIDPKCQKGPLFFETMLCLYDLYLIDETRPLVKDLFSCDGRFSERIPSDIS